MCGVFGVSTEVEKFRESRREGYGRGVERCNRLDNALDCLRTNLNLQDCLPRSPIEELAHFGG